MTFFKQILSRILFMNVVNSLWILIYYILLNELLLSEFIIRYHVFVLIYLFICFNNLFDIKMFSKNDIGLYIIINLINQYEASQK